MPDVVAVFRSALPRLPRPPRRRIAKTPHNVGVIAAVHSIEQIRVEARACAIIARVPHEIDISVIDLAGWRDPKQTT
jgi:hypothetical protein